MKSLYYICLFTIFHFQLQSQVTLKTPHELDSNQTATYQEIVNFYERLGQENPHITINEFGMTDIGYPLQEVIIDKDGLVDPIEIRAKERAILFINNGIHPGEPCGIDAAMQFARDLTVDPELKKYLDHVTVVMIPVYNIGGCLNRSSYSRANQNGPNSYGFRGNAKNYDLNRDFIKCDSKNAQSFNQLFTKWKPQLFIDTHTSNGADYQYTMTLIATQEDKIFTPMGEFMRDQLVPELYKKMKDDSYEMIPYVDMVGKTPDEGIMGFVDYGRYSTGYAALHHVIGFMPETHMLKPFPERVKSTYFFLKNALSTVKKYKVQLFATQHKAIDHYPHAEKAAINWKISPEKYDEIEFKGYEHGFKKSDISDHDRLFYDRSRPYIKTIKFYNSAEEIETVEIPKAYIIPQAYTNIIERLKWNNVEVEVLQTDSLIQVETYKIIDFNTTNRPYEGHYMHSAVRVEKRQDSILYRKGDFIIYTDQKACRYIVETLEPQAPDSYFNWNFMDGILQMKEHFSSYVFEDLAVEILENNPKLNEAFKTKKKEDEKFKNDGQAQLIYIYRNSEYYESTHRLYPIGKIDK